MNWIIVAMLISDEELLIAMRELTTSGHRTTLGWVGEEIICFPELALAYYKK